MEIYNVEEFSRPSAICTQFEVMNDYIMKLEQRVDRLEKRLKDIS